MAPMSEGFLSHFTNIKFHNLKFVKVGSIEAVSDNSQLSVKFPNGEILSAAKAGMALEVDYRGRLFHPSLTPASFNSNTIVLQGIHDTLEKVRF